MKIICTLFLTTLFCLGMSAQEIPIKLGDFPPSTPNEPHRSQSQLPTVTYEDNEVYVYAPYSIESMEVIIYDATGEVIYTYTSAMVPGKNTIILPPTVSESKYCIMLNFNGYHLLGYF